MPVGVQCPISSSLGEFSSYWDWLWCPGLSPVLVSIDLPFAFHTWCFPIALICRWISIVFLLYGQYIATHSVTPSLTHYLGAFPGLGLALVGLPDVVVPEAHAHPKICFWVCVIEICYYFSYRTTFILINLYLIKTFFNCYWKTQNILLYFWNNYVR